MRDAGALEGFVTMVCAEHFPFASVFPPSLRRQIERRSFKSVDRRLIHSHPLLELLRLLGYRWRGISPLMPAADHVCRSLDRHLANEVRKSSSQNLAVYAYEDCAFKTFSAFPNLPRFYELPIGYWRAAHALFYEEKQLNPDWASTLTGLSDSSEKLERKDAELELADHIVVPSQFVQSTLPTQWSAKTSVVEYGCYPPAEEVRWEGSQTGPLRVLFCGGLGQRKGISYLFEAAKRMGRRIELTVIGSEIAPCPAVRRSLNGVRWLRSLTRAEVLEQMRRHDVFVFPTLFEGRALVVLEAISQGLPVITTVHSGAADAVVEGRSGFIVPIRSSDAIVESLEKLDADRNLLHYMKDQAQAIASTITWSSYRRKLIATLALHTAS